ncbi:MAG: hypothetical protein ABIK98_15765 [Pseudomonadota bacterium]|uniref:Uncharacterized protein n=1 Tax=Candidatus Desulfatibia profunda TaxID=2841695 RepID=A0A8J6NU99_9BACT|nr:hypothetical protein [Candidatus Desulfatibia profunda]MBL7179302.1 hypothetical protein [Desulfobacterales bacterium]
METSQKEKAAIEKAGADLFDFAVDREDVKALMAYLPQEADINRVTVEYELQILKIISVGWSISYYLENVSYKNQLVRLYWNAVYEFSQSISATTGLMTGHDIDYFQILKERLDMYLNALNKKPDTHDPVVVIGPEFARICGNINDVFTVMTGSRMFTATIGAVKEYLKPKT